MKKTIHIVNFSGGKDSTAMVFKMIEKGYKIDYVVFCDTGVEYTETYKHLQEVKKKISRIWSKNYSAKT